MNNLATIVPVRSKQSVPIELQAVRERVRDLVEELRARYRRASKSELATRLVQRFEADDEALQIVAQFVVGVVLNESEVLRRRLANESPPGERTRRREQTQATAKMLAQKVREHIWLDMTVTLLTGKQKALRFCLGSEVAELGAAYGRIAERVGADCLVGEVLFERDVAELLRVPPT
jgi:hypothetical protein